MTGNIVLVGFMGVGKGRTARMLAEKTGHFAVDCDDLIESFTNMKVKKIFKTQGEPRFRKLEQIVAKWLAEGVRDTIISTGGGFFKVPHIGRIGTVVYLHSEFDQILQAIHAHPKAARKIRKRPLLQDLKKAEALFAERLPLYRGVADVEIQMGGRGIDGVTDEILQYCSESSY
ncbi:MAG: shikimate kinase [Proteobacteria bacterium]|nr:shikimate kinase [Pseudomonadota bacterium]MBU1056855.1 shikimate kinase [Pseudomonadota bacterium]